MSANGLLTATELGSIGNGLYLPIRAAAAFNAAQAAGLGLRILSAGAYRSLDLQKAMAKNPSAFGASKGVAKAGTSVHGQAPGAIDVDNWHDFGDIRGTDPYWYSANLDKLLAPYGFHRDPRFPNEAWHYGHDGSAYIAPTTHIDRPRRKPKMLQFYIDKSETGTGDHLFILAGPGFYYEFTDTQPRSAVYATLSQISGLPIADIQKSGVTASARITRAQADQLKAAAKS